MLFCFADLRDFESPVVGGRTLSLHLCNSNHGGSKPRPYGVFFCFADLRNFESPVVGGRALSLHLCNSNHGGSKPPPYGVFFCLLCCIFAIFACGRFTIARGNGYEDATAVPFIPSNRRAVPWCRRGNGYEDATAIPEKHRNPRPSPRGRRWRGTRRMRMPRKDIQGCRIYPQKSELHWPPEGCFLHLI